MTPSDAFNAAADYIQEHGLFKGSLYEGPSAEAASPPRVCAWGALCQVVDGVSENLSTYDLMSEFERLMRGLLKGASLADWNDRKSTTEAQVINAFREAAARASLDETI